MENNEPHEIAAAMRQCRRAQRQPNTGAFAEAPPLRKLSNGK
jgi:hypothetical protein